MKHIVDSHCHIYPEKIADKAVKGIGDFYDLSMSLDGRCDTLITEGKKAGIGRHLIFSVATRPSQTRSINEFIASEVTAHPDIFTGLGTLHPDSDDIAGDIAHLKSLGLRGVKLHPDVQGFKIDDYRCLSIYEKCEGELPILFHTGDSRFDLSNPNRMEPILEIFTGLTVIGAHFGGYSIWEEASRRLCGHPNFYVDSSSSLFALSAETATEIIRRYGADKVLFATDFPMWSPAEEIKRFDALPLTEAERERILWKNANELFSLGLN